VVPVARRKTVLKRLEVRKPAICAIRVMDRSPLISNAMAWSIRCRTTNRWGGTPVLCLKSRAKW
jgi:hypothetical protein